MLDVKVIVGGIAAALSLTAYIPYLNDIFKGRTKPHVFSWFIWATLMWVGFAAQGTGNAGPGAWATAAEAIACLVVFVLCFPKGEKRITTSDWVSFIGALLGIALWIVTKQPLYAVIIVIIVDSLGFYPTFRKAWQKPHEETSVSYLIIAISFALGLCALDSYSLVSALYPAYLVAANGLFWMYILIRRSIVKPASILVEI